MRRASLVITLVAVLIGSGATPAHAGGTVKIECRWSHRASDDPIVVPGRPGAAHSHEFFGNRSTNANSTYSTMIGQATTCDVAGDTAGYWVPTLLGSAGQVIAPRRIVVYYRDRPQPSRLTTAFPPDFRLIAGAPQAGVSGWSCDGLVNGATSHIDCTGFSTPYVRGRIIFPSCGRVDGSGNVIKDSPDHRSHVAYFTSASAGCPAAYPIQLPQLTMNVRYGVTNCIAAGCYLASDRSAGCSVPGCSLHADFWNTWNQTALQNIVTTILNA